MYACTCLSMHTMIAKKTRARARARATFLICSSIPRGGVVVVTPRGGGRFHENFMKTPISWNFEVQKCAWNKIILHMVHALLRDPLADPGVEHEPRRFFDAFWREIKTAKIQDSRTSVFVRKHVISKFEIVSSDAVYHIFMQISSLKLCRSM